MTWHHTNTEAAIGLVLLAIGGVLLVWACLRPKYGKPAKRPADSPRLREPFPPLAVVTNLSGNEYVLAEPPPFTGMHVTTTPAPPLRDKYGRFCGKTGKSLTKSPKRVSAKKVRGAKV